MAQRWDVVVIGGGHAGCEAAGAAARMGARTLLLTHRLGTVGEMSCNPAIGGIGKGHLVREIDALDGLMGRAIDRAGIHFKLLNRRKGPAVRGPRAQADRALYRAAIQALLAEQAGLELRAATVEGIERDAQGRLTAVLCAEGERIACDAAVLTAGTFLRGVIHVGAERSPAGRIGEAPAVGLALALQQLGVRLGRLKTGTPPRLARDSIDWESLEADPGDVLPEPFSTLTAAICTPQIECRITGTTAATHALIRENLHRSAVYGGHLGGPGPRYCPSIEDKVVRFAERDRHQIFLEPEGLDDPLVYPNGISTSLPAEVQAALIRTIPGLTHARIVRAGYAVEYDYVDPRALEPSFALRGVSGLFLAGQVNGTTGYEEAAAQGLLAGLNAARHAAGQPGVRLDRTQAYIGVLADDLTTQGVTEPYRMFTSRAEYRLSLRADNADLRLTRLGLEWGCVGSERARSFGRYETELSAARARAGGTIIPAETSARLGVIPPADGRARTLLEMLGRAEFNLDGLREEYGWIGQWTPRVLEQLRTESSYAGYLGRQAAEIRAARREEGVLLEDVVFGEIGGLSTEVVARLREARPHSLGAAARLEGVTPAAIAALGAYLRKRSAVVSRETA